MLCFAAASLYVLCFASLWVSTISAIKFVSLSKKIPRAALQSLSRPLTALNLFNINPRVEIKDFVEAKVEVEISKSVALIIKKIDEVDRENAKRFDEFTKKNAIRFDEFTKENSNRFDEFNKQNSNRFDEFTKENSKKLDDLGKKIDELTKKVDNLGSKIVVAELFLVAIAAFATIVFSIPAFVGNFLKGLSARLLQ
jgi:DNA anti-recombination protein RmuC